jgi:DNA-binding response OmpR family regulator
MRILIVEDDQKLARQLKKGLDEQGHAVTLAFDGLTGLETARQGHFQVLVLDVMLPALDGLSIVRRLRAMGSAGPILLLTARDSPDDIVTGLDAGADDYLTKPFSLKVLLARLRALARRKEVGPQTRLQTGDLMLNPATHMVTRSGSAIPLTRTEFMLLEALLRNHGRVITRDRLIETVWGNEREVGSNTLDVFVRQLRVKIDSSGGPKLIHTIRGVGYTVRDEEDRA